MREPFLFVLRAEDALVKREALIRQVIDAIRTEL